MSLFPVAGGSCLVSCRIDDLGPDGTIIPHGYVRQFDQYAALIAQQLRQMYTNGQRRLSLAIPYFEGGDTFALDSAAGALTAADRANLIALVQLARSIGFVEFVVEMIPEWSAAYTNWQNPAVMGAQGTRVFQPLVYDRDFAFTIDVDRAMSETGAFYHMDLVAEGADVAVCARMWSDWCDQKGGAAGALGFSMVPTQASIDNFPRIYANGIEPAALSVHAYNDTPAEMDWPAWLTATALWPQGFVIGESLCGSPAADQIFAASPDRLFYRFVWPISSNTANVTQDCLTMAQQF